MAYAAFSTFIWLAMLASDTLPAPDDERITCTYTCIVPRGFAKNANPPAGKTLRVLTERQVSVGPRKIKSSHGCFDNAVEIISDAVKSINGAAPKQAITDLDY